MSNYTSTTRTNYFHVKDTEAFKNFMDTVTVQARDFNWMESKDDNGDPMYAFGWLGYVYGIEVKDGDDLNLSDFEKRLQLYVAEDDAVIIFESGCERFNYVTGYAKVITSKCMEHLDITEIALRKARETLDNKDYSTKFDY